MWQQVRNLAEELSDWGAVALRGSRITEFYSFELALAWKWHIFKLYSVWESNFSMSGQLIVVRAYKKSFQIHCSTMTMNKWCYFGDATYGRPCSRLTLHCTCLDFLRFFSWVLQSNSMTDNSPDRTATQAVSFMGNTFWPWTSPQVKRHLGASLRP